MVYNEEPKNPLNNSFKIPDIENGLLCLSYFFLQSLKIHVIFILIYELRMHYLLQCIQIV